MKDKILKDVKKEIVDLFQKNLLKFSDTVPIFMDDLEKMIEKNNKYLKIRKIIPHDLYVYDDLIKKVIKTKFGVKIFDFSINFDFYEYITNTIKDYILKNKIRYITKNKYKAIFKNILYLDNNFYQLKPLIFCIKLDKELSKYLNDDLFDIFNTEKLKTLPEALGIKAYVDIAGMESLIYYATIEKSNNQKIIDDTFLVDLYKKYLIFTDDLDSKHYERFLLGFFFFESLNINKLFEVENIILSRKDFLNSTQFFYKFDLSDDLINKIFIEFFKYCLNTRKSISIDELIYIFSYKPIGLEISFEKIFIAVKNKLTLEIISKVKSVHKNFSKAINTNNELLFFEKLSTLKKKIYKIEILSIFNDCHGFYPFGIKDNDLNNLLVPSYSNSIVNIEINLNPTNDDSYIEMLIKMVSHYLRSAKINTLYIEGFIRYFNLLVFSVDPIIIKEKSFIIIASGIGILPMEKYFENIRDEFFKKNIDIKYNKLYECLKKSIAPDFILTSEMYAIPGYSKFISCVKKQNKLILSNDFIFEEESTNKLKINYVDKFKEVFNSDNFTLYILKTEKNLFQENWKEYCEISFNNSYITPLSLLSNIRKEFCLENDFFLLNGEYETFSYEKISSFIGTKQKKFSYISKVSIGFFAFLLGEGKVQLCNEVLKLHDISSFIHRYSSNNSFLKEWIKINGRNKIEKLKTDQFLKFLSLNNNSEPLKCLNDEIEVAFLNYIKYFKPKNIDALNKNMMNYFHAIGNIKVSSAYESRPMILAFYEYSEQKEFIYLYSAAKNYIENGNVSSKLINKEAIYIKKFFDFLYTFHYTKDVVFEKNKLKMIFTKAGDKSFIQWLKNFSPKNSRNTMQNIIIQICDRNPHLEDSYKATYRILFKKEKQKKRPNRSAIDIELLKVMKDILINEPPYSSHFPPKEINEKHLWWKHYERCQPFLPMQVFLHINMPHRAEHVRTLDVNKFLEYDEKGDFLGFLISTDKNWSREDLFTIEKVFVEIMFSEEDIKNITKFVKYSKEYFPNAKFIYQHNDENNIWGAICPLFPNLYGTDFIESKIYSAYYYKVLLKALLRLNRNIKSYVCNTKSCTENNWYKLFEKNDNNTYNFELMSESQLSGYLKSARHSPHCLRITNITRYIELGYPLEFIMSMSGHRTVDTIISIYVDYKYLSNAKKFNIAKEMISREISIANPKSISKNVILKMKDWFINDKENILERINTLGLVLVPMILDENANLVNNENTIEEIIDYDPEFWKPMSCGICTSIECPSQYIQRCSVCPYLLTNELFMKGISLQVELTTAKMAKVANNLNKNFHDHKMKNEDYSNHISLQKELSIDFFAWQKLNDKLNKSLIKTENTSNELLINYNQELPYNEGLMAIFKEAKDCYVDNIDIDSFKEELSGKIMRLLINNQFDFSTIPSLDPAFLINWFDEKVEKLPKNKKTEVFSLLDNNKSRINLKKILK